MSNKKEMITVYRKLLNIVLIGSCAHFVIFANSVMLNYALEPSLCSLVFPIIAVIYGVKSYIATNRVLKPSIVFVLSCIAAAAMLAIAQTAFVAIYEGAVPIDLSDDTYIFPIAIGISSAVAAVLSVIVEVLCALIAKLIINGRCNLPSLNQPSETEVEL